MTHWDPYEHLDDEGRNEWAVRDQLRAQSYLRELEAGRVNAREKNRRMLAAVVVKPRRCCYVRTETVNDTKRKIFCGGVGIRMVAMTGDWFCHEHDPLNGCGERDGSWRCGVDVPAHGWPHRFTVLDPMEESG